MSFKFLLRLKKTQTKVNFENAVCKNCETLFSGHFCPNCGQSVKEYDKPFSFVFYNFLGDFFAFDMRFFRTLVALMFKPGYLSKEYIDGRRVRYAPPFRIFVFVSFVLFFLLQIYTNQGLTTVLDSDLNKGKFNLDSASIEVEDSLVRVAQTKMDSSKTAIAGSILNETGLLTDTTIGEDLNFASNFATFKDTRDLRDALNKYAVVLEKKLKREEDPEERAKLLEHIQLCRSPEHAMAKILKYISWAFFLLLPILALILKLIYIRRKQNYMRHLIFSIHMHSFIFVVMIVIVGLYMTLSGNIEAAISILTLLFPIYFIIALKRFYGQGIGKTILKFVVTSFLYNIVFIVVLVGAIINALNLI